MLLTGARAQQIQWHTPEEASSAKIGTRLYLFDFYTTWCGYCKKMDRETFTDPTVVAIVNKYYYPVKFNAEGDFAFQWQGDTYRSFVRALQVGPETYSGDTWLLSGKRLCRHPVVLCFGRLR